MLRKLLAWEDSIIDRLKNFDGKVSVKFPALESWLENFKRRIEWEQRRARYKSIFAAMFLFFIMSVLWTLLS